MYEYTIKIFFNYGQNVIDTLLGTALKKKLKVFEDVKWYIQDNTLIP